MRRKGADRPFRPCTNNRVSSKALTDHIRAIHAKVKQQYGWPNMYEELVADGIGGGMEWVRRAMNENGIKAGGKRKFVDTTDSKHGMRCAQHGSGVRQMKARSFTPTGKSTLRP